MVSGYESETAGQARTKWHQEYRRVSAPNTTFLAPTTIGVTVDDTNVRADLTLRNVLFV